MKDNIKFQREHKVRYGKYIAASESMLVFFLLTEDLQMAKMSKEKIGLIRP